MEEKLIESITEQVRLFLWHWEASGMSPDEAANRIVKFVLSSELNHLSKDEKISL